MSAWFWIGVAAGALLVVLWWLDRAPMHHESVPWNEASGLLSSLFNYMRVGAWAEVAPRGGEWVIRLERRRGWRKYILVDATTARADRRVLESFCESKGLRARPRDARTLRIRVLRTDATEVGKELIEQVLVEEGIAPGAALDLRCWGRPSPQASRWIWEAMARRTPIRRGGNAYRRKLAELDERLKRGDD
jgi:hypothetical protein